MAAQPRPVTEDPLPPNAVRSEQRILGLAMLDAAEVEIMAGTLWESDFYKPAHRLVAGVITELVIDGQKVDPVTVADVLTRRGAPTPMREEAPGGGWLAFTTLLLETAARDLWTVNAEYEATLIRRAAEQRALISHASQVAARAYGEDAPEDVLAFAQKSLEAIEKRFSGPLKPSVKHHGESRAEYVGVQIPSL